MYDTHEGEGYEVTTADGSTEYVPGTLVGREATQGNLQPYCEGVVDTWRPVFGYFWQWNLGNGYVDSEPWNFSEDATNYVNGIMPENLSKTLDDPNGEQ